MEEQLEETAVVLVDLFERMQSAFTLSIILRTGANSRE
jgi:hypothetical protein